MTDKTVLLIESGQFIGGVIHSLFMGHNNFCVVEAAPKNHRQLLKAVQQYRPEIIVLDDTVRVEYLAHLLRFMQNSAEDIRVVVVNADSNEVELYEKQRIPVHQTEDFFAIL